MRLASSGGGGELRNGVGLHVLGAVDASQVRDDLRFVARRQQRGQQDDVGHLRVDRRHGRIARVDDDQSAWTRSRIIRLRIAGLPDVRFEGKDRGHVIFQGCRLSAWVGQATLGSTLAEAITFSA